jgi:hypothetical protein
LSGVLKGLANNILMEPSEEWAEDVIVAFGGFHLDGTSGGACRISSGLGVMWLFMMCGRHRIVGGRLPIGRRERGLDVLPMFAWWRSRLRFHWLPMRRRVCLRLGWLLLGLGSSGRESKQIMRVGVNVVLPVGPGGGRVYIMWVVVREVIMGIPEVEFIQIVMI